jgi:hypothetical protein
MSSDDPLQSLVRQATQNAKERDDERKAEEKRQLEESLRTELPADLYDALHITIISGDRARFTIREAYWWIWHGRQLWPETMGWGLAVPDYTHRIRVEKGTLAERILSEISRWEDRVRHHE